MKTCNVCNLEKELTDFNKKKDTKDGYRNQCCECQKNTRNKEKEKNSYKNWAGKNRIKLNEYAKQYRELTKKQKLPRVKKTKEEKLIKQRMWYNNRIKTDPLFKLSKNIRRNILSSFKRLNLVKDTKTQQILNCSFSELKTHIESKWESWMTWDNYGLYNGTVNYGWDIDHIIPTSIATTEDQLIKLNNYTNLKPLCSYVNRAVKQNNYPTIL
jgi:hypothetical protein